jgi:hypothetical protein
MAHIGERQFLRERGPIPPPSVIVLHIGANAAPESEVGNASRSSFLFDQRGEEARW